MGTIIVGITTYPVVFTFPVLWNGWENDNTGYIVIDGDVKRLVLITYIRLGLAQAEWAAKMYPVGCVDGAPAPSTQTRRAAVAS